MLMRTDPFRQLDRLTQQLLGTVTQPLAMPIDAYRRGDEYVVQMDLPGVDPGQIDLTVERNVLTVRAERTQPSLDGAEPVMAERAHGAFSRQLFLGDALDAAEIRAEYRDGVLTIHIPIAEQAKPRKVEIVSAAHEPAAITAA
ncbi:MAG TPA: Hsp20/alpha crystallin family protein [Acidimicrobiales bacterium]|jgi:HSP20 family protein|nr:Hsp20/alpha crystallin family protein [Acidimicrobiales bacterium]